MPSFKKKKISAEQGVAYQMQAGAITAREKMNNNLEKREEDAFVR